MGTSSQRLREAENRGTVDSSDPEREVGNWLEARNWLEDSLFPATFLAVD